MVSNLKQGKIRGMLKFNKDGTRDVLRDVYIQCRGDVVRGDECERIGLVKVVNYTGVGYRKWHDRKLMEVLEGEVEGGERKGFVELEERGSGDMVVIIASVLVFRDWYSMYMFIVRDFGRYWDTELRYEIMN